MGLPSTEPMARWCPSCATKRPLSMTVALMLVLLALITRGCEARAGYLLPFAGIFGMGKNNNINNGAKNGNGDGILNGQPWNANENIQGKANTNAGPYYMGNSQARDQTGGDSRQNWQQYQQRPQSPRLTPDQQQQQQSIQRHSQKTGSNVEIQRPLPPPIEDHANAQNTEVSNATSSDQLPPPPPPPLPKSKGDKSSAGDGDQSHHDPVHKNSETKAENSEEVKNAFDTGGDGEFYMEDDGDKYLPPGNAWFQQNNEPYQNVQQTQNQHEWYGDHSNYQGSYYHNEQQQIDVLQQELDYSLAREEGLFMQLQNLTTTVFEMEQRETEQIHQSDMLQDRIAQIEAQAAADRNIIAEYQANCTVLAASIEELEDELDVWQSRCADLSELREQDQQTLDEWKEDLKAKSAEAEELAVIIEKLHYAEKKRQALAAQNTKKAGFLSWLFGVYPTEEEDDDMVSSEEAHEKARSTLLKALQTERSSVHELESIVSSLQQNNSAISEMVKSRDSIIEELNDRIAVFEEDKGVMKAALRQLQKEMKEEAPKTHKLMKDLDASKKEIKRLKAEINSLSKSHQSEIESMKGVIRSKEKEIAGSESNLTAIGTYVNKLEERLTSFAIARRDIEVREKRCAEIETAAEKTESELKLMISKLEEKEKDEEELKKLFKDMASERSTLQQQNRDLSEVRESMTVELQQAQDRIKSTSEQLNDAMKSLSEWEDRARTLDMDLEKAENENRGLQSKLEQISVLEGELNRLQEEYSITRASLESVQNQRDLIASNNEHLSSRIEELQAEIVAFEEENKKRAVEAAEAAKSVLTPIQTSMAGNSSLDSTKDTPAPNVTLQRVPAEKPADHSVPFRGLRKTLSRVTGLHGVLTPKVEAKARKDFKRQVPPKMPPKETEPQPDLTSDDLNDETRRIPPPLPDGPPPSIRQSTTQSTTSSTTSTQKSP